LQALPEWSVYFPQEPLLEVTAPLVEAPQFRHRSADPPSPAGEPGRDGAVQACLDLLGSDGVVDSSDPRRQVAWSD
jgi:hypothetical protein